MTTDTSNTVNVSQKHHTQWKNPGRKKELLIIKLDFIDVLEKVKV